MDKLDELILGHLNSQPDRWFSKQEIENELPLLKELYGQFSVSISRLERQGRIELSDVSKRDKYLYDHFLAKIL